MDLSDDDLHIMPNLHNVSPGYKLVDGLQVEPSDEQFVPLVNEAVYEHLVVEVLKYEPVPLIFKHPESGTHFRVESSPDVPVDAIEFPFEAAGDLPTDRLPSEEPFYVVKPSHARVIGDFTRYCLF